MLEGYQAVADRSVAFETLAGELVAKKNDKELATLLEEYGKRHAAEPAYQFYTGELHLLRGDAKQAEASFAAALAKGSSDDGWRYRGGLFRARVKSGSAVVTYQENESGTATFEELANLCVQEKDAKQLQALIDAHRKADPDEPHLAAWELEVKWLNQDYEGALQLLNDHREDVFTLPRWRWKANDYRVRALVRLKQTKDAVREAQAVVRCSTGDRLLLALAHAAGGDVKQTIAALEKPRPPDYLLRRCYQDEDLGPILRTDAFREFRDKFPEPKESEVPSGRNLDEP
jgi:hypothetical protein